MKTTLASQSFRDFLSQTLREAPRKLPATLLALLGYYSLPLCAHPYLLFSLPMLGPVLACGLVFLTQPLASKTQLRQPQDRNTMRYLMWATLVSQMVTVAEWAYFSPDHSFRWSNAAMGGLALMALGLVVRVAAITELGKYFANIVYIRHDHQLIQTGTYRYVRHGSYTGAYLIALGIGVSLSAWVGVGVSVVVLGWAYYYRIKQEEKVLTDRFGDDYRAYQLRTWMLIPFVL
ncbi:methyltransferase family protein [Persicitalea jodogahamensis]|uniref:Protein-S-isoprenylcysteine O-methyltransferase n=1 Tax=Persicitalea jodogahamensis TaxID=402147 RepID=A0A8J3D6B0_9BACT|nr:isoprenylcysteine carboxylmethyltransferase family protein [Persicitalea jodogahamensis]GHB88976.1 hypothetical protein GCM10007390_51390 [Persicitalea jodogahamensis]